MCVLAASFGEVSDRGVRFHACITTRAQTLSSAAAVDIHKPPPPHSRPNPESAERAREGAAGRRP